MTLRKHALRMFRSRQRPALDFCRRYPPAVSFRSDEPLGRPHSDACACRHHDHGIDRLVQLELDLQPASSPTDLCCNDSGNGSGGCHHARPVAWRADQRASLRDLFAGKVRRMFAVERSEGADGTVLYKVRGEIFFTLVDRFTRVYGAKNGRPVTIDLSQAHFWDISGVGALDKIIARLQRDGSEVSVISYNGASADIVDRFATHDKTGFELGAVPHLASVVAVLEPLWQALTTDCSAVQSSELIFPRRLRARSGCLLPRSGSVT